MSNHVQEAKSSKLDKFELPAKIKLMPEPWTPESGLVTAALKLKREQVKAKFKDELQKLYKWSNFDLFAWSMLFVPLRRFLIFCKFCYGTDLNLTDWHQFS